jgi:hypothetical protein
MSRKNVQKIRGPLLSAATLALIMAPGLSSCSKAEEARREPGTGMGLSGP